MAGRDAVARAGRTVAWRLVHRLWQGAQQAGRITAYTPAGRAFASFGPGSVIGFPTGALYGQRWIELGAGTLIAAQVWDVNFDPDANVVDVHVRRLRAKVDEPFDAKLIHTVRGVGYVLEDRP